MASNALIILLLIVLCYAAFTGFRKGFVSQIGQLAGLIGGIIVCRLYGDTFAAWLAWRDPEAAATTVYVIAYIILYILAYAVIRLLFGLAKGLIHLVALGWADRIGGALFKFVKWLFIVSFVYNLWLTISPTSTLKGDRTMVKIEKMLRSFAPEVLGMVNDKTSGD
ncbi:MAG: CvpA family protein [Muribaculaceae bacterium]